MPLQLPDLDDRGYTDLVAEARSLIPVHAPEWTNHNPSDPGVTLVELFAYLTEMLIYRLDRVTAENQRKFLKLLNGPGWTPSADLNEDIRTTVLKVRARERAVTAADFEQLAIDNFNQWLAAMQQAEQDGAPLDEWWQVTRLDAADVANLPSALPPVSRAVCVPSRNFDRGTEAARAAFAPGHLSLIVLPADPGVRQPPVPQKGALWGYLDQRRMLTTRHHVVGPYYAPIRAEVVIASTDDALTGPVGDRVLEQLERFLDPLPAGTAQAGWPFGRDVPAAEFYERIETVEGVNYVIDLMLFSECLETDERCAAAPPLWHAEGDLIGLALAQHHLPLARFDDKDKTLVVAPHRDFVPARLTATLTENGAADSAALKRQAKTKVREFFHPLYHGPGPDSENDTDLWLADLETALAGIAGVTAVALELEADPARLKMEGGQVVGLHVEAGELVNWQARVSVTAAQ